MLRGYYKEAIALLIDSIDECIPCDDVVYPFIRDILLNGKKIRPVLTMLSFQAAGGDMMDAIPLALSIELTHNATLVHDDIIDMDSRRRGQPSLHKSLGLENAIVVGDAMISLAVNLSTRYGVEVTRILSEYGFDLCCGELMDVSMQLGECTEEDYMLKIQKKSASLFEASTHAGALGAGGSRREVKSLSEFGRFLGLAYQIQDDLLDIINSGSDFRRGVVTLPIIHLYMNSDEEVRGFLKKNFGETDAGEDILVEIKRLLTEHGSFIYCRKRIDENASKARETLDGLSDSIYTRYLHRLPDVILSDDAL